MTEPTDTAAGRVRAFLDYWAESVAFPEHIAGTSGEIGDRHKRAGLTTADLRAILDEREQVADAKDRIWQAETERDSWKALAVKLDREAKQLATRIAELEGEREEDVRAVCSTLEAADSPRNIITPRLEAELVTLGKRFGARVYELAAT